MKRFLTAGAAAAVILGTAAAAGAAPILEVEFNGTLAGAQVIPAAAFTIPVPAGVFNPPGFRTATVSGLGGGSDIDFYAFTATGGQVYFDIDNVTFSFDTILSLFDSSGTLIALDDDSPPPDAGSASDLDSFLGVFTLPGPGTYYLAVTQFANFPTAFFNPAVVLQSLTRPDGVTDPNRNSAVANAPPGDSSFLAGPSSGNGASPYTLHLSVQNPAGAGQTVPEPLTLLLFGAGLTAAALRLRRH